jgi:tyrosyl-tRNA synthetase
LAIGYRAAAIYLSRVSILEELKWRGLVADCTDPAELAKRLAAPITLYCGFDPTADSLHVGNLVPLLGLRRFQLLGHHPIALAGGATGSIGDPSGKSAERQLLTKEVLDRNIASVKLQLAKLLDFDTKQNPARLLDNVTWTAPVGFLDFLRDIGKHFSVNQMVAKESVRARMEDREVGISYTEFSYMLLQAFDFMVLCRDHNCELQIGGSDQWGNITAGIELTRKKLGRQVFGLTLPLITNADGSKFGKTEAGAIWLDPNKTKPDDFYQFWIRTDDRDVIPYLKFFTFQSPDEICELERKHNENPGARRAHAALAKAMMDQIHPPSGITVSTTTTAFTITPPPSLISEQVAELLFRKPITSYTESDFEFLSRHASSLQIDAANLTNGIYVIDLLVSSKLCPSKGAARKEIENKGIYLGSKQTGHTELKRVDNFLAKVYANGFLLGKYVLLRKGKKHHVVVTIR